MAARRFVRRSFAAPGSFLGGHGILNLDLTLVDQAFDRLVGQVLIRDLPGLTGPQVKGLTPWQSHSERLVCLVQDGFHGRPPANGPQCILPWLAPELEHAGAEIPDILVEGNLGRGIGFCRGSTLQTIRSRQLYRGSP